MRAVANTGDKSKTYRENIELSYSLYSKLQASGHVVVAKNGLKYSLAYHGDGFGGENYLVVASELGAKRKYGWGCYPDQILQALEEMDAGWDQPQRYRYRSLQRPSEVEAV